MSRASFAGTLVQTFRQLRLPLLAYYGVTICVPLANGAATGSGPYLEHTCVVAIAPAALVAVAGALRHGLRWCQRLVGIPSRDATSLSCDD